MGTVWRAWGKIIFLVLVTWNSEIPEKYNNSLNFGTVFCLFRHEQMVELIWNVSHCNPCEILMFLKKKVQKKMHFSQSYDHLNLWGPDGVGGGQRGLMGGQVGAEYDVWLIYSCLMTHVYYERLIWYKTYWTFFALAPLVKIFEFPVFKLYQNDPEIFMHGSSS